MRILAWGVKPRVCYNGGLPLSCTSLYSEDNVTKIALNLLSDLRFLGSWDYKPVLSSLSAIQLFDIYIYFQFTAFYKKWTSLREIKNIGIFL